MCVMETVSMTTYNGFHLHCRSRLMTDLWFIRIPPLSATSVSVLQVSILLLSFCQGQVVQCLKSVCLFLYVCVPVRRVDG